jgi:hypothetical protein
MADAIRSKKPVADPAAPPPETHAQTKPVERKLSPQHNTTEAYGPSSEQAKRDTVQGEAQAKRRKG